MSSIWERQSDIAHISVDLAGEFDAYDLKPLCEVLDGLLGSRGTTWVDLSGVSFLDLRCARELAIRSELCGGRLVLRNPSWQAVSSPRAYGCGLLRESAPLGATSGAEFQRSAVEHEMAWISDLAEEVRRD